jgi:fluoroquinolone resistance protein
MELFQDAQVEFNDQTFSNVECQRQEIRDKEFFHCTFVQGSFQETAFTRCRFSDCTFQGCDLSLIKVTDCGFTNTRFQDSQLIGVNWTEAAWSRTGFLNPIGFVRCAISYGTFMGLALKKLTLRGCVARDVDFSEANLTQADCTGTDFVDSRFWHTNLSKADFTGAINYAIDPTLNVVKKAKFSLPEAMSLLYSLDIVLSE